MRTNAPHPPMTAIRRLVVRQVRVGAVVVAVALGAMVAAIVSTFESFGVAGDALGGLADNPALRALYGVPYDIGRAAPFAVWRSGSFLLVIASLWALRTATRLLRGEEDEGRWDLLLAGPQRRGPTVAVHLGVIAAACGVAGAGVAVAFLATGQAARGAVLYGLGVALVAMTYAALGALCSQLFDHRSRATGVGGLVLGATFALRMLADGSSGLGWLRWATPFGWAEELRAFVEDRPGPLLLLVLAPLALGAAAMALAGRRDLGSGVVASSAAGEAHTRLLGSIGAFAWRQRLAGLAGWVGGAAFLGLVIGAITGSFTEFVRQDAGFLSAISSFGLGAMTTPAGFVGTMLSFAAVVFSLCAVLAMATLWDDERAGRAELIVPQPLRRVRWLGAHVAAASASAALTVLACGGATWVGVALTGEDLGLGDALGGALNTVPLVAAFLGLTVLLHGVRPELALPVGASAVAVAFLVALLGPVVDLPTWVTDLSPFSHLAAVPSEPFDLGSSLALVAVGSVAGGAGTAAYARRDLR